MVHGTEVQFFGLGPADNLNGFEIILKYFS